MESMDQPNGGRCDGSIERVSNARFGFCLLNLCFLKSKSWVLSMDVSFKSKIMFEKRCVRSIVITIPVLLDALSTLYRDLATLFLVFSIYQ